MRAGDERREHEDAHVAIVCTAMKRALLLLAACAAAPPERLKQPVPYNRGDAMLRRDANHSVEDYITYRFADPDRRAKLKAGIATLHPAIVDEMAKRKIAGLAIGVVIDGELAYAEGFGVVAPGGAAPNADTVYRIGSLSKSFTGLALLQLRDAKVLGLDEELETWFGPARRIAYPSFDSPRITLRQLATHSSGLPRDAGARDHATAESLARKLDGLRLDSPPGTQFAYSNTGYGLLSVVVTQAAGKPLRDVVQQKIFAPLGMTATSYARPATMAPAIADGKVTDKQEDLGVEEGSGGIYSTVRDMAKYVAFQLDAYPPRKGDGDVVARATLRESHNTGVFAARSQERSTTYGFGWGHSHTADEDDLLEHSGHIDSFYSVVELAANRGVGVIVLSNFAEVGGVADRVLAELAKTGAMLPRVAVYQPNPKLDEAMTRFLAIYNHWDEPALQALLSRPMEPSEPAEIAGYLAKHGACTGFALAEMLAPRRARYALTCERGPLAMTLSIDASGVTGFDGD